MNIVVTERDKKLLRLVACLAIIVIFGMYLIRPAMEKHETLQNEYDAAEQKQQEYQTQIAALATIDDIIAQNEAALNTASEKYYKGDLETRQMDDIINVNGSSPAWFFRLADIMVKRAVSVGIDADTALRLTAATMEGAARMLAESGKTPEELCRQVCSPGGTTLASLSVFEERDFDGLMLDAMDRCTKRSKELGK